MASTVSKSIKFWIPGRVIPKARPRITTRHAYLPTNYREWRRMAEVIIVSQIVNKSKLPLAIALVEVNLTGKHRGDLDNLAGSCLDALVSAGVLTDDNVNCVPRLTVTYQPTGKLGVAIVIKPQAVKTPVKRQVTQKQKQKS